MILARDRPGRGGDHFGFNEVGFTGARLTEPEDNLNHQHNPFDLIEFMNFDYLRKVVRVNAAYLASLAGAPPTPANLTAQKQDADNFHLTWNVVGDVGSGNTYLITLRSLTSVLYDSLLDVGTKTEFDLTNISTQTWISVAAKGPEKNESLFSLEVLLPQ